MSSVETEKRSGSRLFTASRMSTERTRSLFKAHLETPRWISVDRARLYTEAVIRYASDPLNIRRAKAYRHILENIPVDIHPGELLVGGLTERPNGAPLFPEVNMTGMKPGGKYHGVFKKMVLSIDRTIFGLVGAISPELKGMHSFVDVIENMMVDTFESRPTHPLIIGDQARRELPGILRYWKKKTALDQFEKLISPEARKRTGLQLAYAATHQLTGGVKQFRPDFEMILNKGLEPLIAEAKTSKARVGIPEKVRFYEASIIAMEALIAFAERYASLAQKKAESTADPHEREELLQIAQICRNVPRHPAKTFREAFQAVWFLYLGLVFDDSGMEIPFGRLDQILWPFYQNDLAAGRITRNEALELVEAFFIKASEMEFFLHNTAQRIEDGNSARMTLTIGGIGRDGKDKTNELSFIFLDVAGHAGTLQPNVAVRIHPETPTDFYGKVLDVIASGANTIQLFNDETIITALMRNQQIPLEDVRDYVITGCVQPLPFATYGSTCASHIYLPRTLLLFLNEKGLAYKSFDEFMDGFKEFFKTILAGDISAISAADEAHLLLPDPLVSALVPGPLEKGFDVKEGGSRHNVTGISLNGTGTLVDSLQAINTLVFKDHTFSLEQMMKMLKKDFHGYEVERQIILNKAPKYGNDNPEVDKLAGDFTRFVSEELDRYRTFRGGRFHLGMHTEASHVLFGLMTGATPDGRHYGDPFSVGAGSASGRDRSGYTAFLNSMLRNDFSRISGGVSVNIRTNHRLLEGEAQLKRFGDMIRAYFNKGGPHIQVNVVSTETLRDAQLHPERYGDLLVRISGFSARFVELTKQTQNEIISRSEQA